VFCHYVITGRVLRQRLSEALQEEICKSGAKKLRCGATRVRKELDQRGKRFFDEDSPIRKACEIQTREIIADLPERANHAEDLVKTVRRHARTPSILVRHFPLERERLEEDAMRVALDSPDMTGLTLRDVLRQFFKFLAERCGEEDRKRYIEAVRSIQTGRHFGHNVQAEYTDDELQGARSDQWTPSQVRQSLQRRERKAP